MNTIKYYNNRPVLVLRKDDIVDFYEVYVDFEITDIDLDFIAESYRGCDACMVGAKTECKCEDKVDEAKDLLERIIDENKINDEGVFWVKGKDLKDKPFEWAENTKLKNEIQKNKNILNGLIDIVSENKSLIKAQEKQLKDNDLEVLKSDRIVENRKAISESAIKQYEDLKEKIKYKNKELEKLQNVNIEDEFKISLAQYNELIKSERKLNALESGGVDNWQFYDESLKDLNEEEN